MTSPNLNNPIVDKFGLLQQAWYLYFQGLFKGIIGNAAPLIVVTTTGGSPPSNADAAAAGIQIGQMYTTNNDPHAVYIRLV